MWHVEEKQTSPGKTICESLSAIRVTSEDFLTFVAWRLGRCISCVCYVTSRHQHVHCSKTVCLYFPQTVTSCDQGNSQSVALPAAASFACCICEISRNVGSCRCARSLSRSLADKWRANTGRLAQSSRQHLKACDDRVLIPEDQWRRAKTAEDRGRYVVINSSLASLCKLALLSYYA